MPLAACISLVVKKLDICVQKNGGFMGVYVLCSVRYEI
jgi:hypothetical protein